MMAKARRSVNRAGKAAPPADPRSRRRLPWSRRHPDVVGLIVAGNARALYRLA
jgi:hypothetical protein